MGCGCSQQQTNRGNYANTKRMALSFAKTENVILALYTTADGIWNFVDITCPEFTQIQPLEFISALQRNDA